MLEARERDAGEHHEGGAQQHHVAKIVPRRYQADEQGEHGSPEEGSRRHKPDLDRAEADRREISRQDDDREAIAEPAQTSRGVEQMDVRAIWRHSKKLAYCYRCPPGLDPGIDRAIRGRLLLKRFAVELIHLVV